MASCWFILLSFVGKLSALIHAVPSAVIGGVFAVVCVIILLSGFRVIKNEEFSERELYIIGVPLILAIGLLFMPAEIKQETPQFLQYLLDSPIALSAIAAIVMNKLIPVKNGLIKCQRKMLQQVNACSNRCNKHSWKRAVQLQLFVTTVCKFIQFVTIHK